jgi:hypothetical protein
MFFLASYDREIDALGACVFDIFAHELFAGGQRSDARMVRAELDGLIESVR